MSEQNLPSDATLPQLREQAVKLLCAHFAEDSFDATEFERRLDVAYAAGSREALTGLLGDLPALRSLSIDAVPYQLARPEDVAQRQLVVAVMGGNARTGSWTPPRRLLSLAIMGGVELDFREARFPPGVTEITAVALMGGIDIVVPPWVRVEANGLAILGGFEHAGEEPEGSVPEGAPVLRIGGLASMGAVEISVRLPGESVRESRRRRKEARRLSAGRRGPRRD